MDITPADYLILHEACAALDAAGVPYVIGGGTAVVQWGRQRRTKDFDIFLNRETLRHAMETLAQTSFTTSDTEKQWLYKAWRDSTLVDIIVESRGGVRIDRDVILRSRLVNAYGNFFRIMGPEDTLFRKILTLTEGRPDWYDALSIVDRQRDQLDWTYFLYRAQHNRRRVLSFLLFAQTELNAPPTSPPNDNFLYQGDAAGPVPQWVVFTLVSQDWLGASNSPRNPHRLEDLREAA